MLFNFFQRKPSEESVLENADEKEKDPYHEKLQRLRQALYDYAFLLIQRKQAGQLDEITPKGNEAFELAKKEIEELGFNSLLDKVILIWYETALMGVPDLKLEEFSEIFAIDFHHHKLSPFVPSDIQERNDALLEAYHQIIEVIRRIQGWLDDDQLRFTVEQNLTKNPENYSTIFDCLTGFCRVSLGSDQLGRYNIVFSLDYRIKEMISTGFASTLVRRIYEFTPGALEPFVTFSCLHSDCLSDLQSYIGKPSAENLSIRQTELHEIVQE